MTKSAATPPAPPSSRGEAPSAPEVPTARIAGTRLRADDAPQGYAIDLLLELSDGSHAILPVTLGDLGDIFRVAEERVRRASRSRPN